MFPPHVTFIPSANSSVNTLCAGCPPSKQQISSSDADDRVTAEQKVFGSPTPAANDQVALAAGNRTAIQSAGAADASVNRVAVAAGGAGARSAMDNVSTNLNAASTATAAAGMGVAASATTTPQRAAIRRAGSRAPSSAAGAAAAAASINRTGSRVT